MYKFTKSAVCLAILNRVPPKIIVFARSKRETIGFHRCCGYVLFKSSFQTVTCIITLF